MKSKLLEKPCTEEVNMYEGRMMVRTSRGQQGVKRGYNEFLRVYMRRVESNNG